jgi:hypothetical protein
MLLNGDPVANFVPRLYALAHFFRLDRLDGEREILTQSLKELASDIGWRCTTA